LSCLDLLSSGLDLTLLCPLQIIHFSLLRFVFDPETFQRKKSKSVIRYPASIDMGQFLAPSSSSSSDAKGSVRSNGKGKAPAESVDVGGTIYDLRGVLLHKGGSAYSGHYCAEVYNDE
jgi:ubiquitin C-terminal hydrolase